MALGLVAGDAAQLSVAGVALGDIHLRFAWHAWHLAASTCVAGVALGHIHFRFAWQAWQVWHLVTSTFVLRGRCGTWSHSPSFCVAGVALMASCWLLVTIHHLSHTPSFTHYLCHTQLSRTIFVTHHLSYIIVVRHHLSHTTWSHTHTASFTHHLSRYSDSYHLVLL